MIQEARPATVQAIVDGAIHFHPKDVHPKAMAQLLRDLSFPNPEYVSRLRFGRSTWTTPEEVSLIEAQHGVATIPRGAVALLCEALHKTQQRIDFIDGRTVCAQARFAFAYTLRDYQEQAASALVRSVQGCVVVPCGGGKTVIGAAAIARTLQPALILVHTHDLLEQWVATIKATLGMEAGIVAGKKRQLREVTVATVQTLAALDAQSVKRMAGGFGTVVLDEAHHTPARVFRNVLSLLPAKYRFGLTATPERTDGLTMMLHLCLGPEVFRIEHQALRGGVSGRAPCGSRFDRGDVGCPDAHSDGERTGRKQQAQRSHHPPGPS